MIEGFAQVVGPGTVRFERLLPGPIERVWAYLVEPEKRRRWFAGGPMELCPGGAMNLAFRHSELNDDPEPTPERYRAMENGHAAPGTILEADPPRLLRFLWNDEPHATEVTFELIAEGDWVRLVLTHSRLDEPGMAANVAGGWHSHLAILEDELAQRVRRPFWSLHEAVEAAYRQRDAVV